MIFARHVQELLTWMSFPAFASATRVRVYLFVRRSECLSVDLISNPHYSPTILITLLCDNWRDLRRIFLQVL